MNHNSLQDAAVNSLDSDAVLTRLLTRTVLITKDAVANTQSLAAALIDTLKPQDLTMRVVAAIRISSGAAQMAPLLSKDRISKVVSVRGKLSASLQVQL